MKDLRELERFRPDLAALPASRLAAIWSEVIEELRHPLPGSAVAKMYERLAAALAFSRPALNAGLELVLDSVAGPDAMALFEAAPATAKGPLLAILSATPPGLAVQALLPALALRRPMLLKSSRAEPHFAPLLLELLATREPVLGHCFAATTWRGGDRAIEDPLFASAGRVIAYGGGEAMADIGPRCESFFGFGPKISLAILGENSGDLKALAAGLARDIALLDQRGCLSVQLVLTMTDAVALGEELAAALAAVAEVLPPGPAAPAALAEVRLLREEAALRDLWVAPLPLRQGTVIVEQEGAALRPSPGLRTVRIYPLARIEDAISKLRPWRSFLQGVVLTGSAESLGEELRELGVSRIAAPGRLQQADLACWPNGGLPVLEIFGA